MLMVDGLAPEPPAIVIIRWFLVYHTSVNKIRCKNNNYFLRRIRECRKSWGQILFRFVSKLTIKNLSP